MKIEDARTFEALDDSEELPAPEFNQFERVLIRGKQERRTDSPNGENGSCRPPSSHVEGGRLQRMG
jgi:hypothetical protein